MNGTIPSEAERQRLRTMRRGRPTDDEIERPGPGQESVWDYPRPPVIEPVAETLKVVLGGDTIAETNAGLRVIETAGAPVYYFPPEGIRAGVLQPTAQTSFCEWKGVAHYWSLNAGDLNAENAAWSYAEPSAGFEALAGYVAFYPAKVDACFVGSEKARPQSGGFYGGWVTDKICGPIKGLPGSEGW